VPNVKTVEFAQPRSDVNGCLPNMPCHPVSDRRQESTQLRWRSLGDHFDAAVGQIPYEPANFKTFGQPSGSFPKADPLDIAAVQDLASFDHC
jgi:hypothetical protein